MMGYLGELGTLILHEDGSYSVIYYERPALDADPEEMPFPPTIDRGAAWVTEG